MTAIKSSQQNAFITQLTAEMGPNDLSAAVGTIGTLTSPCYLVIDYDSDSLREVILFDGTFGGSTFVTSSISNRYLEGSAAGSNLTHPLGAKVISTPLSMHIQDIYDLLDAIDHGALSGLSDDDHPQYLPKTGGTLTGDLVLDADPSSDLHAATKQYVDAQTAGVLMLTGRASQDCGSSPTEIDEMQLTIPADWTTFYLEMYGYVEVDPVGYATGWITARVRKSNDALLFDWMNQYYDSEHSKMQYSASIAGALTEADFATNQPISVADLLGDRIVKVQLRGEYDSAGGLVTMTTGWAIKATKVT